MKYTFEEIVKAITIVRETCKECKKCEGCPLLMDDGNCGMRADQDPCEWEFEFEKEEEESDYTEDDYLREKGDRWYQAWRTGDL